MEKAFHRINDRLLVNKLKMYGFTEPLISWLYWFISGRTQTVKYKNYLSDQIFVTYSGVPQWYYLTPILFCMFINDISDVISYSKILLLSDDQKFSKILIAQKKQAQQK